jgi:hypothetical protein
MMSSVIYAGECCIVRNDGTQYVVKVLERVPPNSQGADGPMKWTARFICVPDGKPVKDGNELEISESQIVSRATKQGLAFACFEQGWRDVNDVVAYLADFGVFIAPGTVAGSRSHWLRTQNGQAHAVVTRSRAQDRSKQAFSATDIERWDRFVEGFGGKSRVDDFQLFLRALRWR